MHAVGWTPGMEGGEPRLMIVVGNTPNPGFTRAVYFSDDGGETWSLPHSLDTVVPNGNQTGPNLIQHPVFGLTASWGQAGMQPFDPAAPRPSYLTRTLDAGLTWETREWINSEPSLSIEPAIATWGPGHMVILARDYSEFGYGGDPTRKYFYLTQHVYAYSSGHTFQDVNFTTVATNITGNGAAQSDSIDGRASQDTADVFFNPVTGRIEMLQSHRWGTGGYTPEYTLAPTLAEERSSLNLWSIDPEALLAGSNQRRFDGTVIERVGYARSGNKDGLHPGGSILDFERGLQHIFVYAGWRRGPASIYRISRTLDTDLWLAAVAEVEEELANFVEPEPVVPAVYWTGEGNRYGGQTNGWSTVAYTDPAFPVYGLASAAASLAGDLFFGPGARLRFSPGRTLTVAGTVSFEDDFGIGDIDGLDGTAALGSYQLIAGTLDPANLLNVGINRAAAIGPGRWAYFETGGGLQVNVVDAVSEPPAFALKWIGIAANRAVLEVDGLAGAGITIQSSSDLVEWTDLESIVPAETPTQWTDPAALTEAARFYRILVDDWE